MSARQRQHPLKNKSVRVKSKELIDANETLPQLLFTHTHRWPGQQGVNLATITGKAMTPQSNYNKGNKEYNDRDGHWPKYPPTQQATQTFSLANHLILKDKIFRVILGVVI